MKQRLFGKACALALLLAAGAPGAAQAPAVPAEITPQALEAYPASKPDAQIRFGAHGRARGALRLPKGKGPFPVAMLVHGGCFVKGHATEKNVAGLAERLQREGIATWSVDWRELGDEGAGWPGSFDDWIAAAAELRRLAGPHRLDLSRAGLIGHSAGASAVLWIASQPRKGGSGDLPRFTSLAIIDGPIDLKSAIGMDAQICGRPVIVPFVGGTPAEAAARYDRLSALNPAMRGVRQLWVTGGLLPSEAAEGAAGAAREAGLEVQVHRSPQGDHLGLIYPGTPDFESMEPAIVALIKGKAGR
jgi:acetyl esterase/lipase